MPLGTVNPFRYRGYVYDEETALYYLENRYYNPEWKRFINADSQLGSWKPFSSHNLFCYCFNCCSTFSDKKGKTAALAFEAVAGIDWGLGALGKLFGLMIAAAAGALWGNEASKESSASRKVWDAKKELDQVLYETMTRAVEQDRSNWSDGWDVHHIEPKSRNNPRVEEAQGILDSLGISVEAYGSDKRSTVTLKKQFHKFVKSNAYDVAINTYIKYVYEIAPEDKKVTYVEGTLDSARVMLLAMSKMVN